MANPCGIITAGLTLDCDDPIVSGVEDDVLIANKSEVITITEDAANPMLITGITMATGMQFHRIEGRNQSAEPSYDFAGGRFLNRYDHKMGIKFFSNAVTAKLLISRIKEGVYLALIKNLDGNWELYGRKNGLRQSEGNRNPNDVETGGAHSVLLKTSDITAKEPFPPATFFDTDAATTEAAIQVLLAPAV